MIKKLDLHNEIETTGSAFDLGVPLLAHHLHLVLHFEEIVVYHCLVAMEAVEFAALPKSKCGFVMSLNPSPERMVNNVKVKLCTIYNFTTFDASHSIAIVIFGT